MLCYGYTTKQIVELLYVSRKIVYNHLNSLYNTFHADSRAEMVAIAWEMGLITIKDIQLYNNKKERLPHPEWAAVERKCYRFYEEFLCLITM